MSPFVFSPEAPWMADRSAYGHLQFCMLAAGIGRREVSVDKKNMPWMQEKIGRIR